MVPGPEEGRTDFSFPGRDLGSEPPLGPLWSRQLRLESLRTGQNSHRTSWNWMHTQVPFRLPFTIIVPGTKLLRGPPGWGNQGLGQGPQVPGQTLSYESLSFTLFSRSLWGWSPGVAKCMVYPILLLISPLDSDAESLWKRGQTPDTWAPKWGSPRYDEGTSWLCNHRWVS